MPTGVVSLIVCTVQPYSFDVKIEEGLNGFCFHFCDGLKGFDFTFLFASCSTIKMYLDILNQNSSFTHHCYVATTVKPFSLKHLQAEFMQINRVSLMFWLQVLSLDNFDTATDMKENCQKYVVNVCLTDDMVNRFVDF